MSRQNKAYKFRLYPNQEQSILIDKTIGCARFIYNTMLGDKIKHYEETSEKLNNTPAQYKSVFEWLKEVDSLALANAQINLQTAYNNFFRKPKSGFPKFKSKKKSRQSYTTNNQNGTICVVNYNHIKLPKLKGVKCKIHRQIPSNHNIKSATVSKNSCGKYYISILAEYEYEVPMVKLNKSKSLGLDYSSPSFYVDSQGNEADYPRFYRNAQVKLAKEQRKLSQMRYGSNNYSKQKITVAKFHDYLSNQRRDWLHQLSTRLSQAYDYICVEDINMQNLSQCLSLGKSTNDNGFGLFRTLLQYKMSDLGKQFVKIDKWFPSSKMCSHCGGINQELELSDRMWTCSCGETINRDVNAAINIKNAGLALI